MGKQYKVRQNFTIDSAEVAQLFSESQLLPRVLLNITHVHWKFIMAIFRILLQAKSKS